MKVELHPFQSKAVADLENKLDAARYAYRRKAGDQAVGLTAITGAGKTIIATALIEEIIFGAEDEGGRPRDPSAVFLWMTDLPQLNEQTQTKMFLKGSRLTLDRLPIITNTFNAETLGAGKVYFVNTQLLGEKARLAAADPTVGRPFTFWDVISSTIADGEHTFYMIVDEAHRGMVETKKIEEANSIIQRFIKGYPEQGMPAVPIVLGISATPARFQTLIAGSGRGFAAVEVPPDQVRASGLIKERTAADYAGEKQRDALALFGEAVDAWMQSTEHWSAYHEHYDDDEEELVVPALIIQVENETSSQITATDLDAVMRIISDKAGVLTDAAFAHAFGDPADISAAGRTIRYLAPAKIDADREARIIFFKTSLGTGWDCPRAEVMFSFRKAVEPTSIAQTIGRIVRSPLARKIEEDERLNTVNVFLPYYDRNAVNKVIDYLKGSGGEAVAETITDRSELMSLSLRAGSEELVAAIEQVPTYAVPTVRAKQEVRRLWDLTRSLAKHGLDADVNLNEPIQLAELLVAKRKALEGDADFAAAVGESGLITVSSSVYEWLDPESEPTTATRDIPASEESIGKLWALARTMLSPELAQAYAKARLGAGIDMDTVHLEAAALAEWPGVMDEINGVASGRIDALFAAHGTAISALSPAKRQPYEKIRKSAPAPSVVELKLPDMIEFRRGDTIYAKHLYADDKGEIPLSFTSSWERDLLEAELKRDEVEGWVRNVPRDEGCLRVPFSKDNIAHPFYPDFLFARRSNGSLLIDILDPHDHTRAEAVEKAKGLSTYAREHGAQFFSRKRVLLTDVLFLDNQESAVWRDCESSKCGNR